jgi:hypothetical protein
MADSRHWVYGRRHGTAETRVSPLWEALRKHCLPRLLLVVICANPCRALSSRKIKDSYLFLWINCLYGAKRLMAHAAKEAPKLDRQGFRLIPRAHDVSSESYWMFSSVAPSYTSVSRRRQPDNFDLPVLNYKGNLL